VAGRVAVSGWGRRAASAHSARRPVWAASLRWRDLRLHERDVRPGVSSPLPAVTSTGPSRPTGWSRRSRVRGMRLDSRLPSHWFDEHLPASDERVTTAGRVAGELTIGSAQRAELGRTPPKGGVRRRCRRYLSYTLPSSRHVDGAVAVVLLTALDEEPLCRSRSARPVRWVPLPRRGVQSRGGPTRGALRRMRRPR